MILYNGKQYDNVKQKDLLSRLKKDCFKTLDKTEKLTSELVIEACEILTKDILKGSFDALLVPLLEEFDIPKEHFKKYVSMFTKKSLTRKLEIELGDDYHSLSQLDNDNKRELFPLGILFHIAAGNLDVLPAYSVIEGLLMGNINILKLPTGDKGVSVKLLSELIRIEPKLKDYIYVFDVPSTEIETLKLFADIADAIIVWGGDEAVKASRRMASVNTKIIEWGHKLSFAYASLKASNEDLKGLARNIITTNQLMCSSAQGIFVNTDSREELDLFAEQFFKVLLDVQQEYQEVPFGMKSKNAVELYYEQMIQKETGKKIWKKDGVSVITSNDSELELSMLFRNVWIKMLTSDHIVETIKPHKSHLQSTCILAPKEEYDNYLNTLIHAGLVRIKKPSEMSDVILGESHDGMYPLRLYSRVVETYIKS